MRRFFEDLAAVATSNPIYVRVSNARPTLGLASGATPCGWSVPLKRMDNARFKARITKSTPDEKMVRTGHFDTNNQVFDRVVLDDLSDVADRHLVRESGRHDRLKRSVRRHDPMLRSHLHGRKRWRYLYE